ncbi:MAG: DUF1697 domain-containing protein [Actinomycetota bacterium]|nr:DUF1697 domain-containing protein [Actinomycetota bacterium]
MTTTAIALLRAVNVGAHRAVAMADVAEAFVAQGCSRVRTYLRSGNVVFDHDDGVGDGLAARIEEAVERAAGFAVPLVLRTLPEWDEMRAENPFRHLDPGSLHVAFAPVELARDALARLARTDAGDERYAVRGRDVYLHLPSGVARAALPRALDRTGTTVTVRNWRTVEHLGELASG